MMADRATETLTDEGRPLPFAPRDVASGHVVGGHVASGHVAGNPLEGGPGEGNRESGILERVGVGGPEGHARAERSGADRSVSGSSPHAANPSKIASGAVGIGAGPVMEREAGEREASPVASAMQLGKDRDDEIEITTEDAEHHRAASAAAEDEAIEVSDEEIETTEASPLRATQPSPSSSFDVARSRPPMRPSLRPRAPSSVPLPPPRNGSLPPSGRTGVDPWLLANKTLELAHAHARITELEELVAFRDARIAELEESLVKARRRLGEAPVSSMQLPRAAALEAEPAVVTQTRSAVTLPAERAPIGPATVGGTRPEPFDGEDEADGEDLDELERDSAFDGEIAARVPASGAEEDLQQISGIGPRYEAALRKQGITRLSQIAAWSEADVRSVAKALKIPKSRIVKGRWVEVAREVIGTRAASE
jgi:predicted flap endonuclease-1-like 5' DNA nuclease